MTLIQEQVEKSHISTINELFQISNTNEWREYALCQDQPYELYFPQKRKNKTKYTYRNYYEAQELCQFCPVKFKCLAYAVSNKLSYAHFVYLLLKERKLRFQLTLHRLLKRSLNAGILWIQDLTKMDHYLKNDVSNATDLQNISTLMQVDGVQCVTNALIVPLKYNKTKSPIIADIQKVIQSLINGVSWYPKYVQNARKSTKQINMQKELQGSVGEQVGAGNVLPFTRNNGN